MGLESAVDSKRQGPYHRVQAWQWGLWPDSDNGLISSGNMVEAC
jgi:hypothetical protein